MNILTNSEFAEITKNQTPRLRATANARATRNPEGQFTMQDLDKTIQMCMYSGDKKATTWLKSLKVFAKGGYIRRIKQGLSTYDDHVLDVHQKYAAGELPFNLFDNIMLKDTGKRGTVVDYNPTTKEYIVALDPFQIKSYPKGDLQKIATKVVD